MKFSYRQLFPDPKPEPFLSSRRPSVEKLLALESALIERINRLRSEKNMDPLLGDERFNRWIRAEGRNRAVTGRYRARDESIDASLERYRIIRWNWIVRFGHEINYDAPEKVAEQFVGHWSVKRSTLLRREFRQIAASAQLTRTGKVFLYVAVIH